VGTFKIRNFIGVFRKNPSRSENAKQIAAIAKGFL
jgi:hypothetical protein